MGAGYSQQQSQSGVMERTRIKEPQMYSVVMLNDDFTTMEFVVMILQTVFFHSEAEANRLMLAIHHKGQAKVGTYTYDIAVSKKEKTERMARDAGYPLRLKVEEIR